MNDLERRKRKILKPILFEAGAALYDCQAFEYSIAYLLYLFSRLGTKGLSQKKTTSILDGESKKTAGQLIRMLKQYVKVSESIEHGLSKALQARNILVHDFFIDNVERMADVSQQDEIVKEIRCMRSTVRKSIDQLDPFICKIAELREGFDMDKLVKDIERRIFGDTETI